MEGHGGGTIGSVSALPAAEANLSSGRPAAVDHDQRERRAAAEQSGAGCAIRGR
jgi:hypothetical protein